MSKGIELMKSLSAQEKAKLFDKIAENYYNVNFGSFNKSQIDLLMFSIYLDKLIESGQNFDDYEMSKQLGITQATVRQLKIKKQLIYPREYKWYDSFIEYSKNVVFDNSDRIVISIPDPNVYLELQQEIEKLGGFVEVQLNSKLLKIPPGYFIELLLHIYQLEKNLNKKEMETLKKDFIKNLNERSQKDSELNEKFTEKSFLTKLKRGGISLGLEAIEKTIPGGWVISDLIKIFSNKA